MSYPIESIEYLLMVNPRGTTANDEAEGKASTSLTLVGLTSLD